MAWKHIDQGLPSCDGRTVYVGINVNGFACCFNDMDHLGQCWLITPEDDRLQMSGLLWWMLLERPDGVATDQPVQPCATERECDHQPWCRINGKCQRAAAGVQEDGRG